METWVFASPFFLEYSSLTKEDSCSAINEDFKGRNVLLPFQVRVRKNEQSKSFVFIAPKEILEF